MRDRARMVVHSRSQAAATNPAGPDAAGRRYAACLRRSGPAAALGERRARGLAIASLLVRQLRDRGGTCLRELSCAPPIDASVAPAAGPRTLPGGTAAREGGDMKPFGQGLA